MEFYYNDDLSLSEIADNIGITRQGVHEAIKRTGAALLAMEEKLNLYKRFEQLETQLDKVKTLAEGINSQNNNLYKDEKINSSADEMIKIIEKIKILN